jgi:hypothetical protein
VPRGALLRAGRGIYVLPVESRFGSRAPSTAKMVEGLASQRGETIVSHGASAANALGLTTQVPMRFVYLTSGPSRRLKLGAQTVELRHAPVWQLIFPGRGAGDVVRALAWLGPEKAGAALRALRAKLPPAEMKEVASARAPADLDGAGGQRAGTAWLSSSNSPPASAWRPFPKPPMRPGALLTCWKKTIG